MDEAQGEIDEYFFDPVEELFIDLLEDFSDELDEEQGAQLDHCRTLMWKTLAALTQGVPSREDLTDEQIETMYMGLKSCLMLRNSIRKIVLDARGQPIPSPEELAEMQERIKPKQETVH